MPHSATAATIRYIIIFSKSPVLTESVLLADACVSVFSTSVEGSGVAVGSAGSAGIADSFSITAVSFSPHTEQIRSFCPSSETVASFTVFQPSLSVSSFTTHTCPVGAISSVTCVSQTLQTPTRSPASVHVASFAVSHSSTVCLPVAGIGSVTVSEHTEQIPSRSPVPRTSRC